MIKVRFHLGRGQNYLKWQVTNKNGTKHYYDPKDVRLHLWFCTLHNSASIAKRIWCGATKTVCAWVECIDIEVNDIVGPVFPTGYELIKYNPRILPHWCDVNGNNVDGQEFDYLTTFGNKIYKKL